jgi:hypothetical protein
MPRQVYHESYEESRSRFVTIVTENSQYDLIVNYTSHFFGKALILLVQSHLFGIFDIHDVRDHASFARKIGITNMDDARVVCDYLEDIMPTIYTRAEI